MRKYRLMIELPFLRKGREFLFNDDTGEVYAVLGDETADTPLRAALASYLWLLMTEKKYMKPIKCRYEE